MHEILKTLNDDYIKFKNHNIKLIVDNNEIYWFNAKDIAKALNYKDTKDAIRQHVDIDDKSYFYKIDIDGVKQHPQTVFITESGMYSLIFGSKMKDAKEFKKWVTKYVLPSIRIHGYYKLKDKMEKKMALLLQEIKLTKKQNEKMKNELKRNLFPDGGVVYVLEYEENDKIYYRLGKSDNMKFRNPVHNTHSVYKKKIVILKEIDCPVKLEACVRSMLSEYRIKDRKDFYECDLSKIKKAFSLCVKSLKCMNQIGGVSYIDKKLILLKNDYLKCGKIIKKCEYKLDKYINNIKYNDNEV